MQLLAALTLRTPLATVSVPSPLYATCFCRNPLPIPLAHSSALLLRHQFSVWTWPLVMMGVVSEELFEEDDRGDEGEGGMLMRGG